MRRYKIQYSDDEDIWHNYTANGFIKVTYTKVSFTQIQSRVHSGMAFFQGIYSGFVDICGFSSGRKFSFTNDLCFFCHRKTVYTVMGFRENVNSRNIFCLSS